MDMWTKDKLLHMSLGGNDKLAALFKAHPNSGLTSQHKMAKYNSTWCEQYREQLKRRVDTALEEQHQERVVGDQEHNTDDDWDWW